MKVRNVLILVLLLIAPGLALAQVRPDVEVSDVQWTHDVNKKHRVRGFVRSPGPSPDFMQEVSALFRNTGEKRVNSVSWEYVIYKDSDSTKVERVYKFRSKALLSPGESVRLGKQGFDIQYRRRVEARVVRVEYADGSVWKFN